MREEFTYPMGGADGSGPIDVGSTGSLETNEYGTAEAFTATDADYPAECDPGFIIEELTVFEIGADLVLDLVLADGTTVDGIEPRGTGWVLDSLEIATVTVRDPAGAGGETSLLAVGDPA